VIVILRVKTNFFSHLITISRTKRSSPAGEHLRDHDCDRAREDNFLLRSDLCVLGLASTFLETWTEKHDWTSRTHASRSRRCMLSQRHALPALTPRLMRLRGLSLQRHALPALTPGLIYYHASTSLTNWDNIQVEDVRSWTWPT
jgi:hypothetical protein